MQSAPLSVLVCMKFVPDPSQLQADTQGRPDVARAPVRINTFDENAIEAALQVCAQHGGRAIALSVVRVAPPRDILLRTLAMGVAALYLVTDEQHLASEPFRVASALAAAAARVREAEGVAAWDLVLCGEASVDEYNAQVGPRLAVALDLPAITYARRLDVQPGRIVADRDLEDRLETVEADLPALVTVGMETNQARMPTVLQIMAAGRKPIHEIPIAALPGFADGALAQRPSLQIVEVSSPPSARKRVDIQGENAAQLVARLLERLRADGEIVF
jgi:electron transfer flavoprotein beta subunit